MSGKIVLKQQVDGAEMAMSFAIMRLCQAKDEFHWESLKVEAQS